MHLTNSFRKMLELHKRNNVTRVEIAMALILKQCLAPLIHQVSVMQVVGLLKSH
jgi:hypothetical protein